MKIIVVTGGTGFLGSNLCTRLINEENRVICVDNNYTGRLHNIEYFNRELKRQKEI